MAAPGDATAGHTGGVTRDRPLSLYGPDQRYSTLR